MTTTTTTVKVTYSDGTEILTNIRATWEKIEEYYLGKRFNIGSVTDNIKKAIAIERIERACEE